MTECVVGPFTDGWFDEGVQNGLHLHDAPADPGPSDPAELDARALLVRLLRLRAEAQDRVAGRASRLAELPAAARPSAANLLHYLAVRNVDLRDVQRALARAGLSSLGRAEAHVLASLDAVINRLAFEVEDVAIPDDLGRVALTAAEGDDLLAAHALEVFGPAPARYSTRVMVTLPSEAATDDELVLRLVDAGMAIARINCAHDGPDEWLAMARNVAHAAAQTGRVVRIAVDLAGPKLRTGPIEPAPAVVRVRPARDDFGRVVAPARARLVAVSNRDRADRARDREDITVVPVDGAIVDGASVGDEIRVVDTRGRRRRFMVVSTGDDTIDVAGERTTYLAEGTELTRRRGERVVAVGVVGALPQRPGAISLCGGDLLELRFGDAPGHGARRSDGDTFELATVSVDVPEVFARLQPGHRVLLDDGTLTGVVRDVSAGRAVVEMRHSGVAKLRAEKGINLPDTVIDVHACTDDDLAALRVVAPFADLVALSFVDSPRDVARLHDELRALEADHIGVILKIERRTAFEALPELLLESLRRPPVAVMVARGDLAVEVGFERMAELQEEILWLCEAAHVPVIWATQVLENLAKTGAPTRAEVTDAAWAIRAECVMLNKGPHIPEAMAMLDDILTRMQQHRDKRIPMLRPLSIAQPIGLVPVDAP